MSTPARTPLIERSAPWGDVVRALAAAQKSNRNAQAYSRWINRPFGRLFAATAYKLGMGPNQVSLVSACFTFTGIALIATMTPGVAMGLLVSALLVIGYALDSADGQVARLRGGGSLAGEWLDHVLDAFKMSSFHLAVAVMWFRNLDGWPVASTLIPIGYAVVASVFFFAIILTDLLERGAGRKKADRRAGDEKAPIWTSLAGIPVDYGFLSLVMVLLGWLPVWRIVYIALAACNALLLLLQLGRWYARLSRDA